MDLFPTRSMCSALSCLMKEPSLLETSKIKLDRSDFYANGQSKFHQIIFASISNLFQDGLSTIKPQDIDEFISHHDSLYEIYNQNNGIEFLYEIEKIANPDSYHRYANRIKKFSLLREVVANGFPLEGIYEESEDTEENTAMQNRFEQLTVDDIINHYEKLVNDMSIDFKMDFDVDAEYAGKDSLEYFRSFKDSPQYGVSTCGLLQNSIFRGHLLGASMLRSAPTNFGKSRVSLAEAVDLSIDEWYNWDNKQWEKKNNPEKVLYITTEMTRKELEPTLWAYISGVKEEDIRDHNLTEEQVTIVEEAITKLENDKYFMFVYVPKFSPDTIRMIIKKYAVQHDVNYVFFDYIYLSFDIMQEIASKTKGMNSREDLMLSIFAAGLVELSKEYGFHLSTSTQVNGEMQNAKKLDQNVLRGAKAMADKFTKACIMTKPTKEDEEVIDKLMGEGIKKRPNMIWHIYKNRHSKFKGKLYLYIDFDTMRMTDLFMTDDQDNILKVPPKELIVKEEQKTEEPLF